MTTKEQEIERLFEDIDSALQTRKIFRKSTCNHPNWPMIEYLAMPYVADKLREKGHIVSVSVNWGVTDYDILSNY